MKLMKDEHIGLLDSIKHPKLIAMDVDGTLVPHGGTISDYTKNILNTLRKRGVEIVLVTARPPRWLHPVINTLGFSPISICGNGAITVDTNDFSVIDVVPIEREIALKVIKSIKEIVPDVVIAAESKDYLNADVEYQDLPPGVKQAEGLVPQNRYDTIIHVNSYEEMISNETYKIVAETFNLDADSFLEKAKNAVGSFVNVTRSVAGRSFIEFGPIGLSKAETLQNYCNSLGLTSKDVIAFGDMPNDIEMLEWSGTGVAMGNSHADVLSIADIVAPNADSDGIAKVLEYIYK